MKGNAVAGSRSKEAREINRRLHFANRALRMVDMPLTRLNHWEVIVAGYGYNGHLSSDAYAEAIYILRSLANLHIELNHRMPDVRKALTTPGIDLDRARLAAKLGHDAVKVAAEFERPHSRMRFALSTLLAVPDRISAAAYGPVDHEKLTGALENLDLVISRIRHFGTEMFTYSGVWQLKHVLPQDSAA